MFQTVHGAMLLNLHIQNNKWTCKSEYPDKSSLAGLLEWRSKYAFSILTDKAFHSIHFISEARSPQKSKL